ncbi:molecular chaperone GroES [Actinoplanes sp. SE50]|uniref:zinc-dependent alcohol dehydrogenase n=1 Tax=unclassified Actinoplanes TaxID=2626549 RepID=UPI00023EC445|nr:MULTISPECIES: zinc-dependent alcohol dehydrogenase [unclassified Actinoplanes]AEV83613.1 alcohol dehydrogenase GroES domain protein [Actinoplanes sp. SE50/110]ATO82243.1 molecular chaperone GroES [Actinoplanes sp. SE50]SLL99650.1 glutathione-dependent formaldehyde dehydrogenase [Actinoplanes sp. SE50/110]
MRALTWQGTGKVSVETVPDPTIHEPTDAIVRMTSTAICGSDLHLYDVLGMYLDRGDILGHEPMGIVEAVGSEVTHIKPGDRVVIPFNISCGHCWMCSRGYFAQCETTQVKDQGKGAALFGYTKLYGQVPGAQAEYLRVPQAQFGPIKVPAEGPDERFLFLSDVLTTSWQAARYADVRPGDTVLVTGLGPIGQMCARIARHLGAERVIAVDEVPERLAMAARNGIEVLNSGSVDDVPAAVHELTGGRGADGVIEAVGMEAHGSPLQSAAMKAAGMLPDALARKATETVGIDRMAALRTAFGSVRRAGTISIIGVYGGNADPMPMMDLFDKGVTLRMGQAHVKRWVDDIMPLLTGDGDPLGVGDLVTHRMPLEEAPHAYDIFKNKQDGCIKVVLQP